MIAALDFFTVPTLTFRLLYGFFVVEHDRRRIVHFDVTAHPTNDWILQQLREVLPFQSGYRFMLLDRDAKFDSDLFDFLKQRH